MARIALCALMCAALAATALAAAPMSPHRRSLKEGLFNCGGAQQLGGKCCQLCWCIGNQSSNKAFAGESLQKFCNQKCNECAAAASSCSSSSDALPDVCAKGLQFNSAIKDLVNKCVDIYNSDGGAALGRAQGC